MANIRQPNLKLGLSQPKPRSANYQIQGAESGAAYTNTGAIGAITLTLPKANPNEEFWFLVTVAQTLTIAAATGDTIRGLGASVSSATVGTLYALRCILAGVWEIQRWTSAGGTVTSVGLTDAS